jgi:cytochrome c551
MKKLSMVVAGIALAVLSTQVSANPEAEKAKQDLGKKIYDRAFGRGCGTCHDIKSNPQLTELINAGKLDDHTFFNVLKDGKGNMPKALDAVKDVAKLADFDESKPEVVKAYKEAVDGLYEYLKHKK